MSHLATLSRRLVLPALAIALFAVPAMADGLIARDPPHPLSITGASSSAGGGSGGGQEIMNDDYYHTPKATDPGVKVNVLTAHDKPLDTSAIVAQDPHHKLNVLTASDTPRHEKVVNPIRDFGAVKTKGVNKAIRAAEEQEIASRPWCKSDEDTSVCNIPVCGVAPSDLPCEPVDKEHSCFAWAFLHEYCPPD